MPRRRTARKSGRVARRSPRKVSRTAKKSGKVVKGTTRRTARRVSRRVRKNVRRVRRSVKRSVRKSGGKRGFNVSRNEQNLIDQGYRDIHSFQRSVPGIILGVIDKISKESNYPRPTVESFFYYMNWIF